MASKIKKHRRREETAPAVVTDKIPLVSVIIPMYNSAKFITQTLESLAYQTMKDFEVVVVDDCSTDNSVEVVENFANRVGGGLNLHVIKLPKNTGTPGLPRNVGIQFARGKYIAFLDSDDLFTKTALEELTTLAEKYQADVVQTGGAFDLWKSQPLSSDDPLMTDFAELINPKNFTIRTPLTVEALNGQPFEQNNLVERLNFWVRSSDEHWGVFKSFCRRDFLITNQIFFPDTFAGEDQLYNFFCICLAKKFCTTPHIFYIIRSRKGSVMREHFSNPEKYFIKRVSAFKRTLLCLEEFVNKVDFFKEHLDYRYATFDKFASMRLGATVWFYASASPIILHQFAEKEFHPDDAALSAYLFNTVNIHRLQLMKLQQENIALKNELKRYQTAQ